MPDKFPAEISDKVKQIAIDKYYELGCIKWPTAKEVQAEFNDEHGRKNGISDRYVHNIIAELKKVVTGPSNIDTPWSLGKSDGAFIPDEATGAILEVWAWSVKHPSAEIISIRVAQWVSKLRWVTNAGGSPTGEVLDTEKVYHASSMYAGRERMVEELKDKKGMSEKEKKGMRSGVLDAELMLGSKLRKFAQNIGFLEDDKGIKWTDDLSKVAPRWHSYRSTQLMHEQGLLSSDIEPRKNALAKRLDEIAPDAGDLLAMVYKKLSDDTRSRKLSKSELDSFIDECVEDMKDAHKDGDIYAWNPEPKKQALLYPNRRGRKPKKS